MTKFEMLAVLPSLRFTHATETARTPMAPLDRGVHESACYQGIIPTSKPK